jgi:hypothetical protein
VGGMASLPGENAPHSGPERSPRRMPFWELPTPALADRGDVTISGMANVSCEEQPDAVLRPQPASRFHHGRAIRAAIARRCAGGLPVRVLLLCCRVALAPRRRVHGVTAL